MNIERAIRAAIDTGKVVLGERQTLKTLRSDNFKLAVVSSNCKPDTKKELIRYTDIKEIFIYEYPGSSIELGSICGKPFIVSMLGIHEEGESNILDLLRG
jgi:large subunit ribosomal protein L30e|tara:strand:- start:1239 stop:1538 length:300 start_codon:yes stop_codon:yes gene_type:complete